MTDAVQNCVTEGPCYSMSRYGKQVKQDTVDDMMSSMEVKSRIFEP